MFFSQPGDFFDHLNEVLLFGAPVETGRRNRRIWKLGNRNIDLEQQVTSGQIGYEIETQVVQDIYDDDAREWREATEPGEATARAPFAIDGDTRILGVLQHPTFSASTIANVFEMLLRRGENEREGTPTTEWGVEAVLDVNDFIEWLHGAERVQQVVFTAKLPNPSGLPEFDPIWTRLQNLNAKQIRETIDAHDDERGLQHVEDDIESRGFIAMASNGYGNIRARRRRQNREETYDQKNQVKGVRIETPPQTWPEIMIAVIRLLLGERSNGS